MPQDLDYGAFGKFTWPEVGDQVVIKPSAENAAGFIVPDKHSRLVHLERGYYEAADLLVGRAIAGDRLDKSTLVYPILFLYRHALELSLKYILETYGRYAGESPNRTSHDPTTLWEAVRNILKWANTNRTDADQVVEDFIKQFSRVDPGSMSFRYSVDKGGSLMAIKFDEIDLENLQSVMASIRNYFLGTDGYLDDLVSNKPDDHD
jgi:hypothetical protein